MRTIKQRIATAAALAAGLMTTLSAQGAAPPTPEQLVASLKQNLAESAKRLRTYEWIETTSISLKGEEKARKQQRVYYGADGKLTKLPVDAPAAAPAAPQRGGRAGRGGGLKERVIENKKDEMQEYMERATALIHQYVPPNPELIQKSKDAGKMKVNPPEAGKLRVEFRDFVLPGDLMAIAVDAKALLLSGVNVSSYLDKKDDTVTLAVLFGALTDGTGYSSKTTLDVKAKNLIVVVENSGHRPLK